MFNKIFKNIHNVRLLIQTLMLIPFFLIDRAFMLFLAVGIIAAIIIGPVFCGWACPFGTIQELTGRIGKKLITKKNNKFIPMKVHNLLKYLRYIVLVLALIFPIKSFLFDSAELNILFIVLTVFFVTISLFIDRPFCKYVCPFGAFVGLVGIFRIFRIERKVKECVSCKACDSKCPMNIEISTRKIIKDPDCISCFECISSQTCPVPGVLKTGSAFRKKEKLKIGA